jgi:large subunit ribosomal protein L6
MSRIANQPIPVPKGVEVTITDMLVAVKGPKGKLEQALDPHVMVEQVESQLRISKRENLRFRKDEAPRVRAISGTIRALINNMVKGVTEGFEKKLQLIGVGYRAQCQGQTLNLTLGFSHPVNHPIPEGITIETPGPTSIIVKGIDKQKVGQVSADIRAYRPPEPYKGKGVRYVDEHVRRKETKKK